jgi:hypothetical protein
LSTIPLNVRYSNDLMIRTVIVALLSGWNASSDRRGSYVFSTSAAGGAGAGVEVMTGMGPEEEAEGEEEEVEEGFIVAGPTWARALKGRSLCCYEA